ALVSIEPPPKLKKSAEHSIDLVIYSGVLAALPREAFDRAVQWGQGAVRVHKGAPAAQAEGEALLSTERSCPRCALGVAELDPRWFSFNTKQGQCESCLGTGVDGGAALVLDRDERNQRARGGKTTVQLDADELDIADDAPP